MASLGETNVPQTQPDRDVWEKVGKGGNEESNDGK